MKEARLPVALVLLESTPLVGLPVVPAVRRGIRAPGVSEHNVISAGIPTLVSLFLSSEIMLCLNSWVYGMYCVPGWVVMRFYCCFPGPVFGGNFKRGLAVCVYFACCTHLIHIASVLDVC